MNAYESGLRALRRLAEDMMIDTCTITRPDPAAPRPEMDPKTLKYPEVDRVVVYQGKCKLQLAGTSDASAVSAGDVTVVTQQSRLDLPIDTSADVAVDDVAVIDTAPADSALVGRTFTVRKLHQKTFASARRLPVTEGISA
jgi:predicted GTPase